MLNTTNTFITLLPGVVAVAPPAFLSPPPPNKELYNILVGHC